MKQVLKSYGLFLLEAMALICMVLLCLEQKYLQEIGMYMPEERWMYETYTDFKETYYEESKKSAPRIVCIEESIETGNYLISELIEVYDYADRRLPIKIHSISNPRKEEIVSNYNGNTLVMAFDMAGVYTIKVSAVDDGNRRSNYTIRIPVNNRKV